MFEKKTKILKDMSNFPTEIRKMNYGQLREFREKGLDPLHNKLTAQHQANLAKYQNKTGENADLNAAEVSEVLVSAAEVLTVSDAMTDWILDNVYPDFDFAEADPDECVKLAGKVYQKIHPAPSEIKNS